MPVKINLPECIGCGTCVDECKDGALFLEGNVVVLKEQDCTSCGDCVMICVTGALSL